MEGFIIIPRSFIHWEWYHDNNTKSLFIHIITKASFKEDTWQGIDIKRGQLVTSLESLSRETSLSIQNIRTSLKKLMKSNDITIKSTSKNRVITVLSYDTYQGANKQITTNQQENNSKVTTSKEKKEVIEKKDNLSVIQKSNKPAFINLPKDEFDNYIIQDKYFSYAQSKGLTEGEIFNAYNEFANNYESSSKRSRNWFCEWKLWISRRERFNSKNQTSKSNGKIAFLSSFTN
tara:strand:- start:9639 stop:10337 length:699 start_codon:yes stop_codon:yes gene_type:complete